MIVFDSSTMILLAKADLLDLFISNFHGKVLIPESVMVEVCKERMEESPAIVKLIKDKKIDVVKIKNAIQMKKLMEDFTIDRGEAEAIILALRKDIHVIATDDRNAIRACKMLKISFATTIAILVRAFEKNLMDRDSAFIKLQKLQTAGRYSKAIMNDATKQLKGGG
ncbi:MAG: hypothetical protein ACK41Q_00155 [Candidatus Brocadia sp.]